jgi:lipoprotein-releasing system permease protein
VLLKEESSSKRLGGDYKWDNIKGICCWEITDFSNKVNEDVVISQFLANRLKLKVGDAFNYLKEGQNKLPNIRRFIVSVF